jgi:predicted aminopeptidase
LTFTLILLLAACWAGGCAGPGYYVQAVDGHVALLRQRRDVAAVLAAADTDPRTADLLEHAEAIRRFATDTLALPDSDSYRQFVATGRAAVTWNVIAASEFSLDARRWCFVVAGCVPYRGYFEQDAAERFASRMRQQGWETWVAPATAYSTLGWFADPLLDTMLRHGETELAATIFHELAHQRLYIRGDTTFNESYASFVEELGVRLWLSSHGDNEGLKRWRDRLQTSMQIDVLLLRARGELASIYRSGLPEQRKRESKNTMLEQLRLDYQALAGTARGEAGAAADGGFNNARLALHASYRAGTCAFAELYEASGGNLERFHELAAKQSRLGASDRENWLNRQCAAVASGGDL